MLLLVAKYNMYFTETNKVLYVLALLTQSSRANAVAGSSAVLRKTRFFFRNHQANQRQILWKGIFYPFFKTLDFLNLTNVFFFFVFVNMGPYRNENSKTLPHSLYSYDSF